MLVIADRGFYGWRLWQAAAASGAGMLWRMPAGPSLPVVRAFPDGSYESFLLDPKVAGRRETRDSADRLISKSHRVFRCGSSSTK